MIKRIDLNCDMGESFGVYTFGSDEKLMEYISSANIACAGHAGDPNVMNKTVKLAKEWNVSIGAHPGFPDLGGFGRRMMDFSLKEIYHLVVHQVGSLDAFCKIHQVPMHHVKAHGALYNTANIDIEVAEAIAQAVYDFNSDLILFGMSGGKLLEAGQKMGLQVASEVFADRTYQADGSLTSRREKNALIESPDVAAARVKRLVSDGLVEAITGETVKIKADTVCMHGDGNHAVDFVKKLRGELEKEGFEIIPFNK